MADIKRRPPAIFDRALGEWHPQPHYQRFPYFAQLAAANPVIPARYGRDILPRDEARVDPKFGPFPYFEQPASPVIPPRMGQDVLARDEARPAVDPQFLPFPYFKQPLAANPVIGVRIGRDISLRDEAFVAAHFLVFPYFQAPPNPGIPLRLGQDILKRDMATPWAHPRFGPFPYFEQPAPAPANPAIPFRRGWIELLPPEAFIAPQFSPFPYFSPVVEPPAAPGKGRPTVTFVDRQAVLLWAELQVPEPEIAATRLVAPPVPLLVPAEPVPLVLSGARAVRPGAPTPILVLDASAVLVWAEWRVPELPFELAPDEILALGIILQEDT